MKSGGVDPVMISPASVQALPSPLPPRTPDRLLQSSGHQREAGGRLTFQHWQPNLHQLLRQLPLLLPLRYHPHLSMPPCPPVPAPPPRSALPPPQLPHQLLARPRRTSPASARPGQLLEQLPLQMAPAASQKASKQPTRHSLRGCGKNWMRTSLRSSSSTQRSLRGAACPRQTSTPSWSALAWPA